MILTLGDLISRATEMAGGRTDWTPSDVSFYANLAYQDVLGRARFRGLEAIAVQSTETGENKYGLPTDFDYEQTVRVTWRSASSATTSSTVSYQAVLMKRNTLQLEQLERTSSGASSQFPTYYAVYGDALQLWPTPSSAMSLTVHYHAKPQPLMLSTETLVVDDRWHPAVLFKTVEYLESSRGDRQAEAVASNRFLGYVNSIPNDDALKQQARYGGAASFPREYFGMPGSIIGGNT